MRYGNRRNGCGANSMPMSIKMNTRKKIIHDPDLAKVETALQRAMAREIAGKTRTPLMIYRDGKIRSYRIYNEDIS